MGAAVLGLIAGLMIVVPAVLWLSVDRYVHYTDYHTTLKAALAPDVASRP